MPEERRTILIADDEDIIRNLTCDIVTSLGFEVLTAENGQEALELFRQHSSEIGLVILDLSMPVKDGIQTFHELRALDNKLKIIVSSGFVDDPSVRKLLAKGAFGILGKPFDIDDLTSTLEKAFAS